MKFSFQMNQKRSQQHQSLLILSVIIDKIGMENKRGLFFPTLAFFVCRKIQAEKMIILFHIFPPPTKKTFF